MICDLIVLIAQNITETDEIKNMKYNCSTKHECNTKHEPIPPFDKLNFTIFNSQVYIL